MQILIHTIDKNMLSPVIIHIIISKWEFFENADLHTSQKNRFSCMWVHVFILLGSCRKYCCYILTPRLGPKILFQGNTPEGSDTFQQPVIERDRVGGLRLMIWGKGEGPILPLQSCTGRE